MSNRAGPQERWDASSRALASWLASPLSPRRPCAPLPHETNVLAFPRFLHDWTQVANTPSAGHRFVMQMLSWEYESSDKTLSTLPLHAQYDHSNGKSMVHNTLALHAPDQLRQRMAWALSQVFVIGVSGLGKEDHMEPWFAFYDIFIRHAFGNMWDVLMEISFSPMMSSYLTYLGSESLAKSMSAPDENYAREIMQRMLTGGRTRCLGKAAPCANVLSSIPGSSSLLDWPLAGAEQLPTDGIITILTSHPPRPLP